MENSLEIEALKKELEETRSTIRELKEKSAKLNTDGEVEQT